mgnify:FL=1
MSPRSSAHTNPTTNPIEAAFERLRAEKRRGLIPFLIGGHPTIDHFRNLLLAVDDAGADVIEVGLPFSDPIADGPVIASAMHRTLDAGVTIDAALNATQQTAHDLRAPLAAMTSVSLIHRSGPDAFCRRLKDAGFAGIIVPDAPLEEAPPIADAAASHGLTTTLLIAPSTPADRAEKIARKSSGFIYLLARAGVTGERTNAPAPDLEHRVDSLRRATDLPIACGFGIATPEHARSVTRTADAAIVGSAIIRAIDLAEHTDPAKAAAALVAALRQAIDA